MLCPVLPSGMNKPWAGSDSYQISGLNTVQGSTVSRYLSTSLPFCVRFNVTITRHAATLDTEPLAKSYSDGNHTRLFSNHFQYARSMPWLFARIGGTAGQSYTIEYPLGGYNGKSSEQRDTGSPSVRRGRRMDGEEKRAKAHAWGTMRCGHGHKTCWMAVYSTPRNPQNHAKQIERKVAACPGPDNQSE